MSDTIVLPVPERLFAHLLVVAPQRLPRGLEEFVADGSSSAGRPLVDLNPMVDVVTAQTHPMSTLVHVLTCTDCGGTVSSEVADRLTKSDRFVDIQCAGGPTWPPLHLWMAAFAAEAHAIATEGMPVDPDLMLPLVDDWLAYAFADPWDFPTADWIKILTLDDDVGVKLMTRGMERLGLPDLQVDGLPEPICSSWAHILVGLAHQLIVDQWTELGEEPGKAFREIDSIAQVAMTDIEASFQAKHGHGRGAAEVRLAVDLGARLDGHTCISVLPPEDDCADVGRWKKEVARRLFPRRPT